MSEKPISCPNCGSLETYERHYHAQLFGCNNCGCEWPESLRRPQPAPQGESDIQSKVRNLHQAIAHGDSAHRAWLRDALEAYFTGQPIPPPIAAAPSVAGGGPKP